MTDNTAPATAPSEPADASSALDETAEAGRIASRNKLVIGLLLVSAFVVILNETIMSLALPRLKEDLGIPYATAQWLTTGFMLTMAVVIPITGFLLQRFHTRTIFIAAMSLFSAGTLIAAVAPGFEVLLAGRIVQASGTAIMMPLLMTTAMQLVPPAARGRTMGNISIVISVAPAIGPTISGLILSVLDWRWIFLLVLPVALAALVLGALKIQNVTEPKTVPIDSLSVVLSAFAFGGLIYGLNSIGLQAQGIETMPLWIPIGLGALSLTLFILRQLGLQKHDRALLDLRTFNTPTFAFATVMMTVSMVALFGTIIMLPIFAQDVLQVDTVQAGLILLPGGLIMGLLAPFVGRLYDRFGARVLLIPGSMTVSAALFGMSMLNENSSVFGLLAAHIALSIGLALLFTPLFTASLGSLRPELYSHGSAIIGTLQQLAGAAGTALFITLLTAGIVQLSAEGASTVTATAGGIHTAFLTGAFISLLAVALAFFVRKPAENGTAAPAMH